MSQVTTASGLIIEDLVVGDGAEATAGQHVTVHYTGWLTDVASSIRARIATTPSSSRWERATSSPVGTKACRA